MFSPRFLPAILALALAATATGCAVVPLAVSAVVGPVEGRPFVRINSARTLQQSAAAQATPTPAPTATPIPAL